MCRFLRIANRNIGSVRALMDQEKDEAFAKATRDHRRSKWDGFAPTRQEHHIPAQVTDAGDEVIVECEQGSVAIK